MQLNLSEADESIGVNMFVLILLKGLLREFESFRTLLKYGHDKTLDKNKRDLINFESEKRNDRNTEKSKSVFFTNDRTCFNCHKRGILQNFVGHNDRNLRKRNLIQQYLIISAKKLDILPKIASLTTKFESHAMKNEHKKNSKESQNFVTEEQEEENFSFFSSKNCFEYQVFIIDSGTTNFMIKDKCTFANLDENFCWHNSQCQQNALRKFRKRGC